MKKETVSGVSISLDASKRKIKIRVINTQGFTKPRVRSIEKLLEDEEGLRVKSMSYSFDGTILDFCLSSRKKLTLIQLEEIKDKLGQGI